MKAALQGGDSRLQIGMYASGEKMPPQRRPFIVPMRLHLQLAVMDLTTSTKF
ncbi:MAG: hypothetical protein CSYNP_04363 [Syntrophus sp. SKADARSKE-3]|nr:hypothetical protein [Syntrophus sp. SKADARSKE-3]